MYIQIYIYIYMRMTKCSKNRLLFGTKLGASRRVTAANFTVEEVLTNSKEDIEAEGRKQMWVEVAANVG